MEAIATYEGGVKPNKPPPCGCKGGKKMMRGGNMADYMEGFNAATAAVGVV